MVQVLGERRDVLGAIGKGIGQSLSTSLSEQLPKEVERTRLAHGLEQLGKEKGLTPFERFSKFATQPGVTPQMIQSGTDLLRQQAIIDNINQGKNANTGQISNQNIQQNLGNAAIQNSNPSITTTSGVNARLNPYIPPNGQEQEQMARQLLASDPVAYPDIDSARAAVQSQVAANTNQSNAQIAKANSEKAVQTETETELRNQIKLHGANIPETALTKLQNKALEDVASGKLTPDQAKLHYSKQGAEMDRDYAKIKGWGGIGLITNSAKDLSTAIRSISEKYPAVEDRRDIANTMVSNNGLSPQFAYAQMIPVSDNKDLNNALKSIPAIPKIKAEKAFGQPGLAGVSFRGQNKNDITSKTLEIAPKLLEAMGTNGSPQAVGYELEKKGYDPNVWKEYLLNHKGKLSGDQYEELAFTLPSFTGKLNDWWFKSFTGIK